MDFTAARKCGYGSLGEVIVAQDQASGEYMAVKALSLQPDAPMHVQDRMRLEIEIMSKLEHPNIVRLEDVLVCRTQIPCLQREPPYLCIVMEYVRDAKVLSDVIRHFWCGAEDAKHVALGLAKALAFMHSKGIVHRDVWAENVLVCDSGRVVLLDLGCAEHFGDVPAFDSKLNVPYMSPQSVRLQPQQPGDDSWALGLLITEIATGKFMKDRLGTCDVPICTSQQALMDAVRETTAHSGFELGHLAEQLLELSAGRRLSMAGAVAQLTGLGESSGRLLRAKSLPPRCASHSVTRFPPSIEDVGHAIAAVASAGAGACVAFGSRSDQRGSGMGVVSLLRPPDRLHSPGSHQTLAAVPITPRWSEVASDSVRRYIAGEPALEVLERLEDAMDFTAARKCGYGSLGEVIVAQDQASGQYMAVKALSLQPDAPMHVQDCMRLEIEIMSKLEHPNIVRFEDVLVCRTQIPCLQREPPYLCIVMEYVRDAKVLSDVIRHFWCRAEDAKHVTLGLAKALAFMHSKGIVHRDVWAENVLVCDSGRVVLLDLGCAEHFGDVPASDGKLNVPYMSPQSVRLQPQQPGDDSWALGLLITEIATGKFMKDRLGTCDVPSSSSSSAQAVGSRWPAPLHSLPASARAPGDCCARSRCRLAAPPIP